MKTQLQKTIIEALELGKTVRVGEKYLTLNDGEFTDRCGAYARSTGKPCQQKPVSGKKRCKNHGGLSTGPKTKKGKKRSAANGFKNLTKPYL